MRSFFKRFVPGWVTVTMVVALIFAILGVVARFFTPLADVVNTYVATPIRFIMAFSTYYIPVSVFEIILILLIPSVLVAVVLAFLDTSYIDDKVRHLFSIVGVILLLYSGYVAVMGIPYNTTTLDEHLGINAREDIPKNELYEAITTVTEKVNELADKVGRRDGVSYTEYTDDELSDLIVEAYEKVRAEYPFFVNFTTRLKPVMASGIMSDMGISGIYTYFTGEANVNTSFPDYSFVFTVAHEFAHQRGINRENEANFMAFLVLSRSEDTFLQYSAYLNIYEYLSSALYSTDKSLYATVSESLDSDAKADIAAMNAVVREHRDSPLYKLMHDVNDAYLKVNGTEGVVTYGYVVRLAVAYLTK